MDDFEYTAGYGDMLKVGKYYLEVDNLLLASKAVIYLNRREVLDSEGFVVVEGKRITFRHNAMEETDITPPVVIDAEVELDRLAATA